MKRWIWAAAIAALCAGQAWTAEEGEVKTFLVAPTMRDGMGVGPMTCLQVKTDPAADYGMFYSSIQGFDYVPGFEYTLKVRVTERANVPMDASKYIYTLEEVVAKKPAGLSLENTTWKLLSYRNAENRDTKVLPDTETTVAFGDGRVNGSGGINRFFGECRVEGTHLEIGPLGSTMMAGPEPLMKQEQAFLDRLGKADRYLIVGTQLRLRDADGRVVLILEPRKEAGLASTTWNATMVNNGREGVETLVAGTSINLLFGQDGRVSGNAGCNDFSANYEIQGNKLVITGISATEKMSENPPGVMEQEAAFLKALENSDVFRIDGNALELRSETGALQVRFEQAAD